MTIIKHTFCRICEPTCPLLAEIDDEGRVVQLRPDRDHPVSRGFACHKGLSYLDVHNDPDRLDTPLRRTNPRSEPIGRFEPVSWEEAFADIGQRLRDLRDRHSPHAIAVYNGNPIAFNTKAGGVGGMLAFRMGSRSAFGAVTQDMGNKSAALQAMYGTINWTIPDFEHTNYLLSLGSNPKISKWALMSTYWPMQTLQNIVDRGGKVVFVNPRRIESASPNTGEVVLIKPDTDVYLLAALIHEIDIGIGFNEAAIARDGKNIAGLRAFVARYPAERVAGITGIPAETIKAIAHAFATADGASVNMSTGVNQGRQGTLAYWLLNMLSFVTGNLGRRGGNHYGKGISPEPRLAPTNDVFFDSPVGEVRYVLGQLPGALLPEFIEAENEAVRALIVLSGNPLLTIGGEDRMREAFAKLDLIVSLDLYRNATGEMADYILPSADWLEREDMNHIADGSQPVPFVQYTDAMTKPKGERRDDWWILANIEREMGLPTPLDDGPFGYLKSIETILARGGLSIEKLRAMPHQTALLPQREPEKFAEDLVAWPDKKIDCCPALFGEAIERCETIFQELATEDARTLKLISLRTLHMHNSNLANMKVLKEGRHPLNPLHIHPDDARERMLEEGDLAEVANAHGRIRVAVTLDDSLRPGVVAMSHGYGHDRAPGIRRANTLPGVNVNRLMPIGPGSYEKLSNMSHMTGISVEVARIA